MHDFFKRNSKKLFAVAMVFLMVAFIVPYGASSLLGAGNATISKTKYGKVRQSDALDAQQALQWIGSGILVQVPIRNEAGMRMDFRPIGEQVLGPAILRELQAEPIAYYLLREEARRNAPPASSSEVETLFLQNQIGIAERGGVLQFDTRSPEEQATVRQHVSDLLQIKMLASVRQTQFKASQPRARELLAQAAQQISVAYVEFNGAVSDVTPQPTDEQVVEHFKKYADTVPGNVTEANAFGFGYRLPDAVKAETIAVSRDAVHALVKATQSDYQWTVEAVKQYQRNPGLYTTGPASQPTTAPFESVKQKAVDNVINAAVDAKMKQITEAISQRLSVEFQTFAAANGATSMPSGVTTPTYLASIAQDIQKQFGILPTTTSMADKFYTVEQLEADPDLLLLARDLVGRTIQPSGKTLTNQPPKLAMYEPTLAQDMGASAVIARVIATRPAAIATDLTAIRELVVQDWRRTQAYRLARQAAEQASIIAKESYMGDASTALAAGAPAKPVVQTQTFGRGSNVVTLLGGAVQPLTIAQQQQFILRATDVLKQSNPKRPFLLDLPFAGRAYVASVLEIEPQWESVADRESYEQQAVQSLRGQYRQGVYSTEQQTPEASILASLFEPAQIMQRAGFHDPRH